MGPNRILHMQSLNTDFSIRLRSNPLLSTRRGVSEVWFVSLCAIDTQIVRVSDVSKSKRPESV